MPALADRGRWIDGRWAEESGVSSALQEAPPSRSTPRELFSQRWELWLYVALVTIALLMRLWVLGDRAVHHDESLHGFFAWQLFRGDGYLHNPLTHGMFQFHVLAGTFFLFGDSDFTLRLPMAVFGTALVLVPLLLRPRIGQVGALAAALMLAFSPSLLYFSRFARNDIFMVVFALALVGVMFRYIDERRYKWLYAAAALIALGFTTKETQFIVVVTLGFYLLWRTGGEFWDWLMGRRSLKEMSPEAGFLILLVGLSIPMFGASLALIQGSLPFTLAAPDNTPGIVTGAPSLGWGYAVATITTVALIAVGWATGLLWKPRVWMISWAIFAAIFVVLFTNFFTNIGGIGTGTWQSLGYWIGQQDVRRGSQPWYYYFMISFTYEFLPVLFALGTAAFYAVKSSNLVRSWLLVSAIAFSLVGLLAVRNGEESSDPGMMALNAVGILSLVIFTLTVKTNETRRFLLYWSVATFAAYTLAGEKMPWLLTNIALPFILVAATAINDIAMHVNWRVAINRGVLLLLAGVPLALLLVWRLAFIELDASWGSFAVLFALLAVLGTLIVGQQWMGTRIGHRAAWGSASLVVGIILFAITFRAGWIATYVNSDVPNEMLIYTQTSPDLRDLADEIIRVGELTGEREKLKVSIDESDGFAWPWQWYLRNVTGDTYPTLDKDDAEPETDVAVAVINAKNNNGVTLDYRAGYTDGRRFVHRWWFPEDYRDLTPGQFFGTFIDRSRWGTSIDFFLYRKMPNPIGSVDSFVYFSDDIPVSVAE